MDALCLLLDMHLNGDSGSDVRRRLVGSGVRLPVITITANDNDATSGPIAELGGLVYP
jgi:FixJ family two-component response regulator